MELSIMDITALIGAVGTASAAGAAAVMKYLPRNGNGKAREPICPLVTETLCDARMRGLEMRIDGMKGSLEDKLDMVLSELRK